MRKIIPFLILFSCLIHRASAQSDSLIAGEFIAHNAKGDFDEAQALFAPSLQSKVSPRMLHAIWDKLTTTYGRFQIIEHITLMPLDTSKSLIVHSQFKKANILLAVTFNRNQQIIGYHIYGIQPKKVADQSKAGKDTAVAVNGGKIYGTLRIPQKKKHTAMPVVLIIPGSGAVNRDGNAALSLRGNTYKMLADSLAHYGIASFRYDKRGIGESKALVTEEANLRFRDFVDDAAHITAFLRRDPQFSKIIIAGHSQGSLIGMMVAQQTPINGFISLDGAGASIDSILMRQLSRNKKTDQKEKLKHIIDSIKAGETVKDYQPYSIFNPNVQPLLSSWMQIKPTAVIKKLQIPILIINGTTDLQVHVKQARLLAKAAPSAQTVIIDGMNHILKNAPKNRKENLKTYQDPELGLNKKLVVSMVAFIRIL